MTAPKPSAAAMEADVARLAVLLQTADHDAVRDRPWYSRPPHEWESQATWLLAHGVTLRDGPQIIWRGQTRPLYEWLRDLARRSIHDEASRSDLLRAIYDQLESPVRSDTSAAEPGLRKAAQRFVDDFNERQGTLSSWVPAHHYLVGVHQKGCKLCALEAALAAPEEPNP